MSSRASVADVHRLVDRKLLDKLKVLERIRLASGETVCLAEQLDSAGLHHLAVIRLSGHYVEQLYLDDHQQTEKFIVAAIGRLCQVGEDPNALRREFSDLIREKISIYEHQCDHVLIEPLSRSMSAEVEWLWPGYLAADKLTLLIGEPGVGKTLAALDIAARVTSGAPWPTDPAGTERREPASVILLSEMDDSSDTLRPRLEAVGADLSRVHLVRTYIQARDGPVAVPFSVGGSLDLLVDCVKRVPDCRLVIIDPLSLYVEGSLNRSQITRLLGDLIELAIDKELAILVVSHFGRSQFHYASQLTAKFVAAARAVWRIVDDGLDTGRRVLMPMKNNLGIDRHGLAFSIQEVDGFIPAPKVVWESKPLEIRIQRTTLDSTMPQALPNSYSVQRQLACDWLREQLTKGAWLAEEILSAARSERIAEKALRKALRQIGGTTSKGPTGHYVWELSGRSAHHSFLEDGNTQVAEENCGQACQPGQADQPRHPEIPATHAP